MAKIMLVEDDNNLREIYEARLQAEGYEVVSAQDGEEALVVAKKENPELVISDVMMPKISGFEMLDILRNTDGLKNVKVIMLTALGQVDDKNRADNLGANRYLVKSQVTLEDIVKTAHELLGDQPAAPAPAAGAASPETQPAAAAPSTPAPTQPATATAPPPTTPPAVSPVEPSAIPATPTPTDNAAQQPVVPSQSSAPAPAAPSPTPQLVNSQSAAATPAPAPQAPPTDSAVSSTPPPEPAQNPSPAASADAVNQANDAIMENAINQLVASTNKAQDAQPALAAKTPETPAPQATGQSAGQPATSAPEVSQEQTAQTSDSSGAPSSRKVIKPLTDVETKPDLNELLAKEEAKEQAQAGQTAPAQQPAAPPAPSQAAAPPQSNPATGPNPNDIAL